eukprot:TRINITY_DN6114_c0_g2_i1.p1 TRINITY_DN6114_c0_g2~~TRINITY_DN6114_c0_g2_i1.p1  ORF type:complete len:194 (+),score=51.23 TRINITY_DN6114_c0_g2_i1:126-707(+)
MESAAAYPPPPPYYKLYSKYGEPGSNAPDPPPPIEGVYQMYGQSYTTEDKLPSLEEQGVHQLYPKDANIDFKGELSKLNQELHFTVLELVDILIERPSQYARRVEDIAVIMKNIHHLLNAIRPHQARAALIHRLEMQLKKRQDAVANVKQKREEAQAMLREAELELEKQQGTPGDSLPINASLFDASDDDMQG